MKKKFIPAVILIISLLLTATVAFIAYADDDEECIWEYDSETKTLYIEDEGPMKDFESAYATPWNPYILSVENVVIFDDATTVGAYSFAGAENLKHVEIGSTVTSINAYAFSSCPNLTEIEFSENVTSIADFSFAYDGVNFKDFTVKAPAGSYALFYAINHNLNSLDKVNVVSQPVKCGEQNVRINVRNVDMMAYFPYVPKYDGTFKFYSTGTHDALGYVYDSNFNELMNDDDSGVNTNFSIESISLTAGETYYFGAKIYNPSLKANFPAFIEPVEYTLSGTIYAMNDPSGAASDIVIDEAKLDGVATGGSFTRTVTSANTDAVITAGTITYEHSFSPDEDADIIVPMCDVNNDGYVNGRDLAYMKATDSKYKPLFGNFI